MENVNCPCLRPEAGRGASAREFFAPAADSNFVRKLAFERLHEPALFQ